MKNRTEFTIGKTKIGEDNPCFIVAEIGINFDGKFEKALKLVDIASEAKCNAVKFQLFTAERMYPKNAGKYKTAAGKEKDIFEIVKKGELPTEWLIKFKKYANLKGLEFFSCACDEKSADILEKTGVDVYKITSYEITHIPLLRHIARKGKLIIFSCGGARIREVAEAIEVFKEEKNNKLVLMHCIGQYPAALDNLNLKVILMFRMVFPEIIIGYSDHSLDPIIAPRAAVSLGAKVIEKHITLDKNLPGPDHSFALEPSELKTMVKTIRQTEKEIKEGEKIKIDLKLLGTSERKIYKDERYVREFTYRCLFAIKDISKGEKFTKRNIAVLRPGKNKRGLHPRYYELLIRGYKATRDIPQFQSLTWNDVLMR